MSRILIIALALMISACGQDSVQVSDAEEPKSGETISGEAIYQTNCAACHDGGVAKAPHKDMIGLMTAESIHLAMNSGLMQAEAASLDPEQRVAVAEYLAGESMGTAARDIPYCQDDVKFDGLTDSGPQSWGIDSANSRSISADAGGIDASNVATLSVQWAIQFPGANRVRSQPAFAGGLLFVGSHNGKVYALDPDQGCQTWSFQAAAEVRTGILVKPWRDDAPTTDLYFGDVLGNVYALDAASGQQRWPLRADDHPNATITATPTLVDGNLYIPISSLEVSQAVNPAYPCCTFRGSILAVDANSGEQLWRTYTIAEKPEVQGQTDYGTDIIGPSGAVVWNTPALDLDRRQIYFGTGENMSSPATATSDAIFALDMDTGDVNWIYQATAQDAWNTACDSATPQNCPEEDGPDFDFGAATILAPHSQHGHVVLAGQKSGMVHAIHADTGKLVWQTRVGRGGIQGGVHFGMAAHEGLVFVPISDMADGRSYPNPDRPGMHAVAIETGEIVWSTLHEDKCTGRDFCHPGISQAPTVVGDLVLAGGMDGWLRAYRIADGEIVWSLDTTQSFDTVNGATTHGGSMGGAAGPIAHEGQVLVSSGYGIYNHMMGNLLLLLKI